MVLALALLLASLAGCGSSGGSSSGSSGSSSSEGASSAIPKALQKRIDELYAGDGFVAPPGSGPPAEKGKTVWVLSCNEAVASCHDASSGAVEAARALGWTTNVVDTKFEPSLMAQGLRQAIAAHADGVITYVMDCPLIKQPLAEAEQAGLTVVTAESLQCKGTKYDAVVSYSQGPFEKWWHDYGAAGADLIISGTEGDAKVIMLDENDIPSRVYTNSGYETELEKCEGCETVDTVQFSAGEVGSALQQKVQQALVQHPEATAIWMPFDLMSAGVLPALRASGRASEIFVDVAEGQADSVAAIKEGVFEGGGVALPQKWEGYASADALNRLLAGDEPVPSGIGLEIWDNNHGLPSGPRWESTVDYVAGFEKSWGGG